MMGIINLFHVVSINQILSHFLSEKKLLWNLFCTVPYFILCFHAYIQITNLEQEKDYSKLIAQLLEDHRDVVTSIARAFHEVKNLVPVSFFYNIYFSSVLFY